MIDDDEIEVFDDDCPVLTNEDYEDARVPSRPWKPTPEAEMQFNSRPQSQKRSSRGYLTDEAKA